MQRIQHELCQHPAGKNTRTSAYSLHMVTVQGAMRLVDEKAWRTLECMTARIPGGNQKSRWQQQGNGCGGRLEQKFLRRAVVVRFIQQCAAL